MNVRINSSGDITINVYDMFEHLIEGDARSAFLDAASCKPEVIKNVMDMVLTGFTEAQSSGADYDNGPELLSPIGAQRRRIMELSINDLKDKEIERLKARLDFQTGYAEKMELLYYELKNAQP